MASRDSHTMLAAHLQDGELTLTPAHPRPEPQPGETRVAVHLAGICATDLALARGYMGFSGVPGHEFVGRALEGPLEGRRVVGEINAGCGRCTRCRGGDARHCEERSVLGILQRPGAFAEELRLPEGNLLPVPDGVADEAAVFVEPLAAAGAILEQVGDVAGLPALVIGDGRLGLCCAAVLAIHGARVEILGRHPERAALLPRGTWAARWSLAVRSPAAIRWSSRPAVDPSAWPVPWLGPNRGGASC
jgi:threonine dehydrogenase-like Zn-dependent dehydrogenase